jgi:hypothetical protein
MAAFAVHTNQRVQYVYLSHGQKPHFEQWMVMFQILGQYLLPPPARNKIKVQSVLKKS